MKRNIYLMYMIALFQGMVFYAPIATFYRQERGISVFQITVMESLSLFLCIILEIPWGIIADRIGYKKTMVVCCWLYFLSKIVFWKAATFIGFMIERIMLSIVSAGMSGVDDSLLYCSCTEKKCQNVFGIYEVLQMIGLLFATFFFTFFLDRRYETAACCTVISYGMAACLSLGLKEVKTNNESKSYRQKFSGVRDNLISEREIIFFLVGVAFLSETHQTITVFLSPLKYRKCGFDDTAVGILYIWVTIAGMAGTFSSRFTEKTGREKVVFLFGFVSAAACFILAIGDMKWMAFSGIFLLRILNSLFQPFQMQIQNQSVYVADRATMLSIYAMGTDSIAIGTNLIFGALAEKNLEAAFLFGTGISIVSMFLFAVYLKNFPSGGTRIE